MKTLLILRHAKAEADAPRGGDKDRALTGGGERDAATIAQQVRAIAGCPDLIVSSDAKRARQTAKIVAADVRYAAKVKTKESLYGADLATLLRRVRRLPANADRVLLVGHNPGFEELAALLAGDSGPVLALPTAGLAHLEFDVTKWEEVGPGSGRLRGVYRP